MESSRDLTPEEYDYYLKQEQSGAHRAVPRSVPGGDEAVDDDFRGGLPGMKATNLGVPMIRTEETSLMNCTFEGDRDAAEKMWLEACQTVKNLNNVDPMVFKKSWKTIGNYYQHGSFCEFLMALYQSRETKQHVLDFKRMSGDGFVMDAFFRQVKTDMGMPDDEHADGVTDGADDSDDMFDYSSDEEETTDLEEEFLRPGGFLKLAADKNLIVHWMDQVKNRHIEDQNHMMGLMAHNSELEENRAIMLGHLPEMLDMIIAKLLQTVNANAALVRNASVLLHNLLLNITAETLPAKHKAQLLEAIFKGIQKWVPRENEGDHLAPISQSREAVKYLSMAVASLLRNKVFTVEEMNASRDVLSKDAAIAVVNVLQFITQVQAPRLEDDARKVQEPILNEACTFFAAATSK